MRVRGSNKLRNSTKKLKSLSSKKQFFISKLKCLRGSSLLLFWFSLPRAETFRSSDVVKLLLIVDRIKYQRILSQMVKIPRCLPTHTLLVRFVILIARRWFMAVGIMRRVLSAIEKLWKMIRNAQCAGNI